MSYYIDKINKSSVLIYGINDNLTDDITKKLILGGVSTIYLYNNNYINKYNKSVNLIECNDYKQNQQIMIIINQSVEIVNKISDYCSEENIKLIVVWSKGISGVIHVNANLHLISDIHNYEIESVQVSNISKSGVVICMSNHNLSNNDTITFYNIEGDMGYFKKEWVISVINKNSFLYYE
jgi:ribosomal protein L7Ae-like RNA K-turn-binding protein